MDPTNIETLEKGGSFQFFFVDHVDFQGNTSLAGSLPAVVKQQSENQIKTG